MNQIPQSAQVRIWHRPATTFASGSEEQIYRVPIVIVSDERLNRGVSEQGCRFEPCRMQIKSDKGSTDNLQSFDRYWLDSALILQRCFFASFESRADPQLSTTPGSMKTATKFPPIPDRVLYTLRFVQVGFDCHIVPYSAQAAMAIRHKAKEAGRSLGEQLRGRRPPASPVPRWPRAGSGPRADRRPAACDAAARRWFGSGRAKVRLMQRGKGERNP